MNSEDCLVNFTERPFPKDVILQVEVYHNKSEIWLEREQAVQDLYNRMYIHNDDDDMDSRYFSTGWIRDYCETSPFINLTGARLFCQLILNELFGATKDSTMEPDYKEPRDAKVSVPDSMKDSCAKENLNDYISRYYEETIMEKEELSIAAFYSKNYTLYDLIEFYSK